MVPDSVGAGTVKRLGGLPTGGGPVLSVYLDLEAASLCTPGGRDAQLGSLLREPGLRGAQTDIECVRQLLRSRPWLARGARGLAIFSAAEASMLEVVRLPSEVQPMLVLDTEVWLEPLADMVAHGDWGVALLGKHFSRLFRGGGVITPLIEGAERTTERALLARLEECLERGERVAGLDRTLELLSRGRVEVLLTAHDARLTAGQRPRCGHVSTVEARCACHGVRLISVDAIGHAVKLACEQAARVVVMRHESDALTQHGSIAMLTPPSRASAHKRRTHHPPKEATHAWSTHTLGPIR